MLTERRLCECAGCGRVQAVPALAPGAAARCIRCGQLLRRTRRAPLTRPLAFALAGLALYGLAVAPQFLRISLYGLGHTTTLLGFPAALGASGFWELAAAFLLFVVVLPPLKLALLAAVLAGARLPRPPRALRRLFRWYGGIGPWAMVEVFLVGAIVAYVRMADLVQVEVGAAVWGLAGLMLATFAADVSLDPEAVWQAIAPGATPPAEAGPVVSCPACGLLCAAPNDRVGRCPRCGARLWPRKPASLSRTWAFLIAAAICAVGAYALPVMTIRNLGRGSPVTIVSGIVELASMGWWPIAGVVFLASLCIPLFKLAALGAMLVGVHRGSADRLRRRTQVFRFVAAIGRWSMIDVFVVSLLTALVQLGFLANVRPERGVIAFGAVVLLTMLAAFSFDPRLMWDAAARGTGA